MNAKTAPLEDRPLRTEPIRPTGDAGDGWGRAAAYDAYADGLHTYAIWLLRDHDAAVDALYCTYVLADHHVTQLRQPEHIQPWLYGIMRRECSLRASSPVVPVEAEAGAEEAGSASASVTTLVAAGGSGAPSPASGRLRPPGGPADPGGSLASLERNLRRAEFHSLEWPESEGLAPAHREILELTIRHGLDSQGLGLVLGLGQSGRSGRGGDVGGGVGGFGGGFAGGAVGSVGSQGFGVLADAWRELERSLAAVAVAKASREHCAQLAELTFGWSGRLTATLRQPLTEHVDGCTRCQHYLHTVIGTPAAPTILPFVAAPRALREMLLGELHDPQSALRLGIDHEAIAARIQRFAANGFPAVVEPAVPRRRGGRRAAPKGSVVGVVKRKSAVTPNKPKPSDLGGAQRVPGARTERPERIERVERTELPRRTPGASMRSADARVDVDGRVADRRLDEDADAGGVYRAPGSWAARVLPADTAMEWKPGSSGDFISTPSGRFAARAPIAAESAGVGAVNGRAVNGGSAGAGKSAAATVRMPVREASGRQASAKRASGGQAASGLPAGRQVSGRQVSGRREARPARRAVLSAVTLGAVGAAAAAAAALLGAASDGHSPQLADIAPPQDPVSTARPNDGLSVSVSTPAASGTSAGARGSNSPGSGGLAPSQGGGTSGISGTVSGAAGSGAGAGGGVGGGSSSGQSAGAADFMVSVNQRAADPDRVTILLRNIGSAPVSWSAAPRDAWIALSQRSGTLAAGQSLAIVASVTSGAPSGAWTSAVTFSPGGAVVTLRGVNSPTSGPSSQPTSASPSATPSSGGGTSPGSPGQGSSSASAGPTPSSTPTSGASLSGASSSSSSTSGG